MGLSRPQPLLSVASTLTSKETAMHGPWWAGCGARSIPECCSPMASTDGFDQLPGWTGGVLSSPGGGSPNYPACDRLRRCGAPTAHMRRGMEMFESALCQKGAEMRTRDCLNAPQGCIAGLSSPPSFPRPDGELHDLMCRPARGSRVSRGQGANTFPVARDVVI